MEKFWVNFSPSNTMRLNKGIRNMVKVKEIAVIYCTKKN